MSFILITLAVFLCACGGILLGAYIRGKLPEHHLSEHSRDIAMLSTGVIATLTALVLGLLVASANDTFESFNNGLEKMGADILLIDRAMAAYGPETQAARQDLRQHIILVLLKNWPEDKGKLAEMGAVPTEAAAKSGNPEPTLSFQKAGVLQSAQVLSSIQDKLLKLTPKDNAQRWWQAKAQEMGWKMAEERWQMAERSQDSLPTPFLVVLVIWLVILFAIFSLFAPGNKTVTTVLLLCAISVSWAIFLILELNKPTSGLLKASSEPLFTALGLLGR